MNDSVVPFLQKLITPAVTASLLTGGALAGGRELAEATYAKKDAVVAVSLAQELSEIERLRMQVKLQESLIAIECEMLTDTSADLVGEIQESKRFVNFYENLRVEADRVTEPGWAAARDQAGDTLGLREDRKERVRNRLSELHCR